MTYTKTLFFVLLSVYIVEGRTHHGFGVHYDTNQYITLEGVVTRFKFINPHAFVYFETTGVDGEKIERWCETQARTQLMRKGVTRETFKPGTKIKVEGFQARRDPNGCEMAVAHLPDGNVVKLRSRNAKTQYHANVIQGDTGIIGTWHIKKFPGGTGPKAGENLTQAGLAAHSQYDSLTQNPLLRCSPMSPSRAWSVPGVPTKVSREENKIIIQHEFMDTVRTVHLDRSSHPGDFQRSDIGHSIGRIEDSVLFIETAMFGEGALDMEILHSDQFTLKERLAVNPDTDELEYSWTANDPIYYTQELMGSKTLIRTDLEISPYNCEPHE